MPQLVVSDFSSQLIWLVITFVVLYLILWRVALPRIAEVMDERQRRITDGLEEAERLKAEAETAIQEYETALAQARAKAHDTATLARDRAAREVQARRAALQAELATEMAAAEARIAESRQAALANLRDVAIETAQAVTARLIGAEPSAAAAAAAVNGELEGR
ncbi:MAG TPA: F0F1 ATP synthase subunit B' [Alphaproteobacteria bacterium]|jgi:F-type H+-transporting ATPase subunit b|nr:F0F1 ATP synthase subunit B' [Alphaproteobacteria bacterium]MDP7429379.1 F0F1 ATP synthase subunit B' [Alphaproteobacteria bacterium]HJM48860.1 F0F1 ATP synthase subunit B' [Alphaproteobacteria bacterium]